MFDNIDPHHTTPELGIFEGMAAIGMDQGQGTVKYLFGGEKMSSLSCGNGGRVMFRFHQTSSYWAAESIFIGRPASCFEPASNLMRSMPI